VPIADVAATSRALNELINDSETLEALALQARQKVIDCYTVEQEAAKLLNYFQSLH
jgi:glycosyltransferase involved in cell wall biosynthesis